MFNYPATELFDAQGARRVVWSQEEHDAALTQGYTAEAPVEPSPALLDELKPLPVRRRKEVINSGDNLG